MWKFIAAGLAVIVIVVAGFSLIDSQGGEVGASAIISTAGTDLTGYARAIEPYDWSFPRDHGAHNAYQTEWWYYTGNLKTESGRHFGYQFTVFRRAITPPEADAEASGSEWRTNQIYMAHFTISDIDGERFFHDERYSRGGAGLAGALPDDAQPDENYRVFLEDWTVYATNAEATEFRITAVSPKGFKVDLQLDQAKPTAFQGYDGLSPKSAEIGNASYYYSLTRLLTDGVLTVDGETFEVSGNTWMDHEFSTSALGETALGWDWFGLQFDDNRELMVGKIRQVDGGREPAFGGLLVQADGSTIYLESSDFVINATGEWTSPHTGATYPSGWEIVIDGAAIEADEDLTIIVTPLAQDQELHSGDIAYWEGAVALSGDVTGYGYGELTGYVDAMTGRF